MFLLLVFFSSLFCWNNGICFVPVLQIHCYSDGSYAYVSYVGVAFYLLLCSGLLFGNWKKINPKKKFAIGVVLIFEFTICVMQGFHHTWLISGMGITLMTLSFYLTLENPDIILAELTEQKMSMLYPKSQVNPHRGKVVISVKKDPKGMEIAIQDNGSGFDKGKKELIDERYLQEHLDKEISLNILADEFHLSSQYISQLFKSEIGVNFFTCLTSIRMERAKKLLLATSFSIGEISVLLRTD